jgi:hypothetical protein
MCSVFGLCVISDFQTELYLDHENYSSKIAHLIWMVLFLLEFLESFLGIGPYSAKFFEELKFKEIKVFD